MKTKIIAEVASNHSGDMLLAKKFIQTAAEAGVDFVKFQSSRFEDLISKDDPQAEWVQKTSLSDSAHFELMEECRKNNIAFLTTCFSQQRIDFLKTLHIDTIKVASPDLLSFSMIEKLAECFKNLIISTGMHSKKQIKLAIDFLNKNKINATLLHAVSIYPTPLEKSYMYKFLWLKDNYSHIGYSHHSQSIEPLMFAMANGAEIIEAHMKLGPNGPGRATAFDIMPSDFINLVRYRDVISSMLGDRDWIRGDDFMFDEEIKAANRFVGRWGNNK